MNIVIMTGARPNFVKAAPLLKAVDRKNAEGANLSCQLIYAGAEDDPTLESSLFEDLQMRRPDVYLGIRTADHNEITSEVMTRFGTYLDEHPADVVIVVDDLASTMGAAIVAKKKGVKLAHLVAGTRSFDINMPKEINRLVIDGLSDLLFTAGTATGTTADPAKIYDVGNILIDTLRNNIHRLSRPAVLDEMEVKDGEYVSFTVNRKALLADEALLRQMLVAIDQNACGLPVIAPLRGAAKEVVGRLSADLKSIRIVEPLPYLEFGYLTAHARCVITDSGNIAEEATFHRVACITLNNYTEHIETVKEGSNVLVNENPELLAETLRDRVEATGKDYPVPDRWDGRTSDRIVQILVG